MGEFGPSSWIGMRRKDVSGYLQGLESRRCGGLTGTLGTEYRAGSMAQWLWRHARGVPLSRWMTLGMPPNISVLSGVCKRGKTIT